MTTNLLDPQSTSLLDKDGPDTVRMSIPDAEAVGMKALRALGFSEEDAKITVDQLIDNALCGYRFTSLPRILAIAENKRIEHRAPVKIVHETPLSALMDGGNNVGYVSVYHAAQLAIKKAKASGFAIVGVNNSYFSGRNAYYTELVVKEGFVCVHVASAMPRVVPPGGAQVALGTNPMCLGFPTTKDPLIIDIGTASMMWGDVGLHAHLGLPLPEGIGVDANGKPSTDAAAVLEGGVVPFGGHKGYGLSLAVQALGLLAGSSLPRNMPADYGFVFLVIDPRTLQPGGEFEAQATDLINHLKSVRRQPGVDEIRVPSERAFRERRQRLTQGLVFDKKVIDSLEALSQ
ncbi:Ldh family oxidoreductase [Verticiella sediminum]|nr:Ldh family oxidoreductase [Verticiella sediminum]